MAGVDGIGCFVIEMSSATQNWLKISDGQGPTRTHTIQEVVRARLCSRMHNISIEIDS